MTDSDFAARSDLQKTGAGREAPRGDDAKRHGIKRASHPRLVCFRASSCRHQGSARRSSRNPC